MLAADLELQHEDDTEQSRSVEGTSIYGERSKRKRTDSGPNPSFQAPTPPSEERQSDGKRSRCNNCHNKNIKCVRDDPNSCERYERCIKDDVQCIFGEQKQ